MIRIFVCVKIFKESFKVPTENLFNYDNLGWSLIMKWVFPGKKFCENKRNRHPKKEEERQIKKGQHSSFEK